MATTKASRERDANAEKFTRADLAAHVDKVVEALDEADLRGLVERLHRAFSASGMPIMRVPFAIRKNVDELPLDDSWFLVDLKPQVCCRATHLVLARESANAFELCDFKVGRDSQLIAHWGDGLPLEPFSVEFVPLTELATVMQWRTEACEPGIVMSLCFRRRSYAHNGVPLRGILWAETFA